MSIAHFFTDAPAISWQEWLKRKIFGGPNHMTILPPMKQPAPEAIKMLPARASDYSKFLKQHFYDGDIRLDIPPNLFENYLNNLWIGAEVRIKGEIIGLVVSQLLGTFQGQQTRLITWLCVRPDWRKKGITNKLLRSVYVFSEPTTIFWWRNDGWIKSPLPPVYTQTKITRQRQGSRVSSSYSRQRMVQQIPVERVKSEVIRDWTLTHPCGIVLDGQDGLAEAYQYTLAKCSIIVIPTFETTNGSWCEVLAWSCSDYNATQYIEEIISCLPYDWIEAPSDMPHMDGWTTAGVTSWSVIGLDIGTANQVPILSLLSA
jgi:hypothetical protein